MVPLFLLGILLGLGVMLGFVFLIVPCILLGHVGGRRPRPGRGGTGVIGGFGRSRFLTKGARWSVFGVGVVIVVLYWIFSAISGAVMIAVYGTQGLLAAMQQGSFWFLIGSALLSTLSSPSSRPSRPRSISSCATGRTVRPPRR